MARRRPLLTVLLLGVLAGLGPIGPIGTGAALAQAADDTAIAVERIATLPTAPVASARLGGDVALLLQDGRLVAVPAEAGDDAAVRTVRRGLDGETLVTCAGRWLAVDGTGRLVAGALGAGVTGSGVEGPPVSLHATPACLSDGTVVALDPEGRSLLRLGAGLEELGRVEIGMLPDAAPAVLTGDLIAVLIGPTLRYRHGVLGDEVEASGVAVIDPVAGTLLARWTAPDGRVVEDRRVVPLPAAGRWGVVATVSGAGDGGALVVLAGASDATNAGDATHAPSFAPAAVASGLGQEQGQRWRHVLGAAGDRLYAVAAPHLGGPLERWRLPLDEGVLNREAFDLFVTSHREGRRELSLGRLLDVVADDPPGLDLLLLPSRDLDELRLVACDDAGCRVTASADLGGRLATAPLTSRTPAGDVDVVAAREDGALLRFRVPHDRILTNSE